MTARVAGWAIAGAAAVLSSWLLWPRWSHVALRATAASVLRAVAATVATPDQGAATDAPRLAGVAHQELAALRSGFVVAQRRPSGATRRDRALAELATELDRALKFAPLFVLNSIPWSTILPSRPVLANASRARWSWWLRRCCWRSW